MTINIEYDLDICLNVSVWSNSLTDCISSLYENCGPVAIQIIAVDQSPHTRPEKILERFPELVLYDNNGQCKTTEALNNGLRLARGRYVALWDTAVKPQPACIEKLIRFLDQNPESGICGPKILSEKNSVVASSGRFPLMLPMLVTCRMANHTDKNPDDLPREVDWVKASAMVIRREVLADTGILDEGFKTDLFDLDLCRRAKNNGWHLWYFPDATATSHLSQKTTSSKKFNGGDVIRLFLKKYFPMKNHH